MDGRSGAGVVVHPKLEDGSWGASGGMGCELGELRTVYEAELVGIKMALKVILRMVKQNSSSNISYFILADNQSALLNAFHPLHSPGQQIRSHLLHLHQEILKASPTVSITLAWVPGHQGIEGNEEADEWAKKAARGELEVEEVVEEDSEAAREKEEAVQESLNLPKSSTAIFAHYKSLLLKQWDQDWRRGSDSKYLKRVDLHAPSPHILRLHDNLPRPLSSLLTQLRSGHSYLNADLFRSKRSPTDLCLCGAREDITHFFLSCPFFATQRQQLTNSLGPLANNLPFLLSSPQAIPHTLRYVVSTGRFPRYHSNKIPDTTKKVAKERRNGVGRTGNTVKRKKTKSAVVQNE